jgi:transposase
MSSIPKGSEYLPNKTLDELVKLYKCEKDSKACLRLLSAIHRKKGLTVQKISEMLMIPISTVSDNLRRLSNNFDDLYDKRNQRRPPKLTANEYQKLINALNDPPNESGYPATIWTTKMINHYIKSNFNKSYTTHGVRKLLHRANFVRLKPRPYHLKGNKKQQEQFKKNYPGSLMNICKMDSRSSFWMSQDSF